LGILVILDGGPNLDVYVDGEPMPIAWIEDGKTGRVDVPIGTHLIELKNRGNLLDDREFKFAPGELRTITAKPAPRNAKAPDVARPAVAKAPDVAPPAVAKAPNPDPPGVAKTVGESLPAARAKPEVPVIGVAIAEAKQQGSDDSKAPLPPATADSGLIAEMKFIRLPQGKFWMGGGRVEGPPKKQAPIDYHVELAALTVTQGQWQAIMGDNPSWFSRNGKGSKDVAKVTDAELKKFPVESVSWDDVAGFLTKLNERENGKGWEYRLPKEAEWEYACRNAAQGKAECSFDFYFAKGTNDLSSKESNFDGTHPGGKAAKGEMHGRPKPVGSYAPNELGFYDMQGNVWQWCDDSYIGAGGSLRGGGWSAEGQYCRAARGVWREPSYRSFNIGFRLARVPIVSK
jgi:formylglycine-generating enzyme required for sulfatase activity